MNLVVNRSTPQLQYAENIEDYSGKAGGNLSGKLADGFLTKLDQAAELDGYITKSRSPSCGLGTTPLYTASRNLISKTGSGLFISALVERYPQLPIIDETELENRIVREQFIADVTAYNYLRKK
jgi:uncharacterized protein YbbK (DUF523 family)